ncbi:hypothetical protein [Sinorhizobium meliloti]|uniref:hypothetical protein n=1 Tax=Rhizobium meliloti TaxID=382 RepID=UPI00299E35BE
MTKEHLTTLWKWLSLGCFVYVVGSVITLQGGADVFGAEFLAKPEHGAAAAAYFTVILGSGLLCLALVVAMTYARRHGSAWHERVPVVMLEGLRTATIEGKIFQGAVIFVLLCIPVYGIAHSIGKANEGTVCELGSALPPADHRSRWQLVFLPSGGGELRLVSGRSADGKCEGGVEVGWYTPPLFAGLPFGALVLTSAWLCLLFRSGVRQELATKS